MSAFARILVAFGTVSCAWLVAATTFVVAAEPNSSAPSPMKPAATQVYKSPGDRDLKITLTFPKGWSPKDHRSAIVFFYNGGWKPGAANRQFNEQADYFARRGMVCAQADYREKSKEGVSSVKCIEDTLSAIRWLRKNAVRLGIHPDRIAAAGGSGSIHLAASALYVDEIHAKDDDLSISPRAGAMFLFDSDVDVLDPAMMRRLLTATEAVEQRRQFSPTIYFYGSRDAMQPYAADFAARAKTAGLPIETFVLDGGIHGSFKFSPWLEKTTARMDEQLRRIGYLSDEPQAKLPSKTKPPGVDQRILANQARWLQRHKELERSRNEDPDKKPGEPPALKKAQAASAPPSSQIYKTVGERKLQVALHCPPGWRKEDKRPAILFFAGGGENPHDKSGKPYPLAAERAKLGLPVVNAGPGSAFADQADYFAQRGLVGVRVEYRKRKTDGALPGDAVQDAVSAMRWVRKNAPTLGIDPDRIVACGGSSGGHLSASLAALGGFESPDDDRTVSYRPNALILHFPLLDFLEGGTRTTTFLSALEGDRELGLRLSPLHHWHKDLPPTLVLIGTKDPMFQTVSEFVAKWKAAGQNIDLFIGEGGGHGFSLTPQWAERTTARTEEFLRSIGYLGDKVPSEPLSGVKPNSLLDQLRSHDPASRHRAVAALAKMGPEARAELPAIIAALRDEEWLDLTLASEVLFRGSPKPSDPTPVLIQALNDPDRFIRAAACYGLARLGPEAAPAVPLLSRILQKDDKHARNFAATALAMIGPEAREAVAALRQALCDDSADAMYVRAAAALALGAIGPEARDAAPDLLQALDDELSPRHARHFHNCVYLRAAAAYALARIGDVADSPRARAALERAGDSENPLLRYFAVQALGGEKPGVPGQGPASPVRDALAAIGASGEKHVRDSVSLALGYIGTEQAIQVSNLRNPADGDEARTRHVSLQALGKVNRDLAPLLLLAMMREAQAAPAQAPQPHKDAAKSQWVWPDPKEPAGCKFNTFYAETIKQKVSYLIWLPPGYDPQDAQTRYPVIYLLHGGGGNYQNIPAAFLPQVADAIKDQRMPPIIGVVVNGLAGSLYVDSADGTTPVESIVIKDLIPQIDATYRTDPKRRALEGFSMGGYGATHLAFKYPELFLGVADFAGAVQSWEFFGRVPNISRVWGGEQRFLAEWPLTLARKNAEPISKNIRQVFIAVGDRDTGRGNTLEANKNLHQLLNDLKIPNQLTVVPGVKHSYQNLSEHSTVVDKHIRFYADLFGKK